MPRTVVCPHCGTENPASALITVCKQCKGSLAGARPVAGPPDVAPSGAPPVSRPLPVSAPPPPSAPSASIAPAPSVAPPAPAQRPAPVHPSPPRESPEPVFCDHCGTRNEANASVCSRCHRPLEIEDRTPPPQQRPCPRCGRIQDATRRSCYHCGLHFLGPDATAHARLPKPQVRSGPSEVQRAAVVVLGCIWAGFAALIAIFILIALFSR